MTEAVTKAWGMAKFTQEVTEWEERRGQAGRRHPGWAKKDWTKTKWSFQRARDKAGELGLVTAERFIKRISPVAMWAQRGQFILLPQTTMKTGQVNETLVFRHGGTHDSDP